MTLLYQIELRNDTAANWTAANTVLGAGEPGVEIDTNKFKIGDGSTAWNALAYAASNFGLQLNGSRGTPNLIDTSTGVIPLGVPREIQFIAGNGAPVTVTATPPVAAGTSVGQELILQGRSDSNTVTLHNAAGLALNGSITLSATGPGGMIYLVWDGTNWNEVSRQ